MLYRIELAVHWFFKDLKDWLIEKIIVRFWKIGYVYSGVSAEISSLKEFPERKSKEKPKRGDVVNAVAKTLDGYPIHFV